MTVWIESRASAAMGWTDAEAWARIERWAAKVRLQGYVRQNGERLEFERGHEANRFRDDFPLYRQKPAPHHLLT